VQAALAPRVERRAEDELYAALVDVDLAAFDDPDFTHLVERVVERSSSQFRHAVREAGNLTAVLVSAVSAIVTAGILHPLLAPAVLLAVAPQAWASIRSAKIAFDSWLRTHSQTRRFTVTGGLIAERDNAAEVRAFTTQDVLLGEHRRIADDLMDEAIRMGLRQNRAATLGRVLSGVGTGVGYGVLGLVLYTDALPLALAGTAVLAMRAASSSIVQAVYLVSQLYESGFMIDLHRTCVADVRGRRRCAPTAVLPGDPEVIELCGVSFRYPGQDDRAIEDVTLRLLRGQVIALVGENGSGKSTLAKLLTGLYLPERGTVRWDGVDTAAVDARTLHDRVAVVMQDPLHWPMTAANNVRIGRLERPDPEDTVLNDVAARSGADVVLAGLPDGAATMLSRQFQTGRDLSGGQWQRISVARGLYRDAPLVVADEPTAAMDARAEHAVFAALREMGSGERITVLVTHRLANVRSADQILVLERGRIIERGRHDELMAERGTYYELFSLQARSYGDGSDTVSA
jgi:ATP-binding cassette subfamily B protein